MIAVLSIVVPCFNEARSLPTLYQEVMSLAPSLAARVELVLVDDGSEDDSPSVMAALAAADPRVRVLGLSRNFGKESAMLAGLRASTGDAVALIDGDLQHPPAVLATMVQRYAEGHDQVVARRDRAGDPLGRRVSSRAYYALVNRLIDVRLENGVGDFRLMSRAVVNALLELEEANRFSKGLFTWLGFDTAFVDYHNVRREQGASRWGIRRLVDYGVDGVISFNSKPLRIGIWLGLLAVVVSVAYVAWLLVRYLRVGVEMPGYLTTIAVIVGLGGVQLVFLGIIGEYIGRIYAEVKSRPHYIVKSRLNWGASNGVTSNGVTSNGATSNGATSGSFAAT